MATTNRTRHFSGQRVVLTGGTIVTGKNIRTVSADLFQELGGDENQATRTLGYARVNGREIPVFRKTRNRWEQAGAGVTYNA
jgi:hypothetical protein